MRELATVTVGGAGAVVRTVVRPGMSVAREVVVAAAAAASIGLSPGLAAADAQIAVLDRLLAQLRGGR